MKDEDASSVPPLDEKESGDTASAILPDMKTSDRRRNAGAPKKKRIQTKKRFSCAVCEKRFGTQQQLRKHERTHSGEKPFSCVICNRAFSLASTLVTHTGEKPFQCVICNRSFSVLSALVTHKRTHTGEKPFQCAICNQAFSQSTHLTRHTRTHAS
jgi:KRAB domain-containing zinc finger protein